MPIELKRKRAVDIERKGREGGEVKVEEQVEITL